MSIEVKGLVNAALGHIDRRVYSDPEVYQMELEQVFGRAWLFIGHESLIPNPNDFFLSYMGEDPVILTRDSKGELHAFLNMCRHRGNRVVRADDGNAKNFMCTYHGWTFSNEGKLVSVPGLQEAYYGELDVENLGLVSVAHLDTYAGFVFATWAEDAPTLEANLGNMRWYVDTLFNRRDGAVELIGPEKWIAGFNYKVATDNFVGDQYHAPLSHRSAFLARANVTGRPNVANQSYTNYTTPGYEVAAGNGHGLGTRLAASQEEAIAARAQFSQNPVLGEYLDSIRDEMERRLGHTRGQLLGGANGSIFPNMSFLWGNGTVRVWQPRGPLKTEVWSYTAIDASAPAEVKRLARITCMQSFGPSGLLEQDDMDNWHNASDAGNSREARKSPGVIHMGLGHEMKHDVLPGTVVPNFFSEVAQRGQYARWQEFMNARSWADIHIDPITAKFEGTATMKG